MSEFIYETKINLINDKHCNGCKFIEIKELPFGGVEWYVCQQTQTELKVNCGALPRPDNCPLTKKSLPFDASRKIFYFKFGEESRYISTCDMNISFEELLKLQIKLLNVVTINHNGNIV